MESRMEKYYKDDLSTFERTKKNEKLYKDVSSQISDLDNLPIPDNANEIDVNGLKDIIIGIKRSYIHCHISSSIRRIHINNTSVLRRYRR